MKREKPIPCRHSSQIVSAMMGTKGMSKPKLQVNLSMQLLATLGDALEHPVKAVDVLLAQRGLEIRVASAEFSSPVPAHC
jgi:hypothetical protein